MRMTKFGNIKMKLDKITSSADRFFGTEKMGHFVADTSLDIQTKTDLFPYYSYDEEAEIYMNDSSVGFVLRVLPISHLSESEIDALSTLFNELEEGYSVECLFYANPHNVKAKFESWKNVRAAQGGIIKELAQRRIKFLEQGIKKPLYDNSPSLFRDYEIWLSVTTDNLGSSFSMLETKKKLEKIRKLFETQIEGLGSFSTRIDPPVLIRFCSDILDIGLPKLKRGYDKYNSIASEISRGDASVDVDSEHIVLNESCTVKTYAIKKYPEVWHQGGNDSLFGNFYKYQKQISCPFIFHYGFRVINQSSQKTKAFYNMTRSTKAAESPFAKFLPGIAGKARDSSFLYHKLEEGNLLVHSTHNLVLFADDPSKCDTYEQQLKNLYQENGFEIALEKDLQLVNFLSVFPMMLGNNYLRDFTALNKTRKQLSWTAGNLISLKGGYKGNTYDRGMLLSDRRGQILNWSAFEKDEGNYNICVVGKSGAGKSFLMQEIITTNLGDGGRVFIIDDGYSYEKTCKLIKGEFIEVDEKLDISLNPFGIINKSSYEDDGDYRTEIKSFLENILCQMARGTSSCSEEERADIKKALDVVLESKLNNGSIDDVISALEATKKERSENLAHLLLLGDNYHDSLTTITLTEL